MAKPKPSLLAAFDDVPDVADRPAPAPVAEASPQKAKATKREKSGKGRDGQKGLTFWLDPAFDLTLSELEIQLKREGNKKTRGELGAEAMNLLFRKHGVPVVGE